MQTLSFIACFLCSASVFAEQTFEFEVFAGEYDREQTVVSVSLADHELDQNEVWQVSEVVSDTIVPSQIDNQRLLLILPEKIKAGDSQRFRMRATPNVKDQASQLIEVVSNDDAVAFRQAGKTVFTYHKTVVEPPTGVDPAYRRSGFSHPVVTPNGQIVSDAFPEDHPHQHALFAAWTKCKFDGHAVDFWNQAKKQGTVEHREVSIIEQGQVFNRMSAELVYVDLTKPEKPVDVIQETWTMQHFAIPGQHLFEIHSSQICIADKPLLLEEYLYGGMAFCGSGEWSDGQGDFLTSDGKTRKDGNHTRPNWVAIHGKVNGQECGAAVFSHPANFRSPQPVRLHPQMPYFVFSPPVLGPFEIKPNDPPLNNRYLYVAFDGSPDVAELNQLWNDYAHPVETRWVMDQ